jgi:hypothetical protein
MAQAKKKNTNSGDHTLEWPFGKKNYILFAISLFIITVGFIFLGSGDDANAPISLTVAPILLVIGYALIPFAIMARGKNSESESGSDESASES